jgi:hypothetical protein
MFVRWRPQELGKCRSAQVGDYRMRPKIFASLWRQALKFIRFRAFSEHVARQKNRHQRRLKSQGMLVEIRK